MVKDAAEVRIIPPAVPLVTILVGVLLQYLWPIATGFEIPRLVRFVVGGSIVGGAVLGLGLWSVVTMRRTGQTENPYAPTTEIVERGPFRLTRNPMYLQMVLVCFGVSIILTNIWLLVLTPVCAWILQNFVIAPEEAYLERKFGDRYLDYKKRVRRWL